MNTNIQERETMPTQMEGVFQDTDTDRFRNRWRDIQASFVDEPRQAVERADELVAAVTERLTQVFTEERARLEQEFSQGNSTEDLRLALRRYRAFFDRLLSI